MTEPVKPSDEVEVETWLRRIDVLLCYPPVELASLLVDVLLVAYARTGLHPRDQLQNLIANVPDELLADERNVEMIRRRIKATGR